jgi:hypothetical protein
VLLEGDVEVAAVSEEEEAKISDHRIPEPSYVILIN